MKLTICGAARTVTGSMHLLEACGKRFLLECGFFQGKRKESLDRNRSFPFDPKTVDFLLLSHAHIDHCGNLPNLVRQGFDGPVFCTHATRDLAALMLEDSAHIQEADCLYINKRNRKLGKTDAPVAEPLYTVEEARRAVRQLTSVAYDRSFAVADGITVTFCDAGHILGSAEMAIDLQEYGKHTRLVFSGDLGRGKNDILRDPTPFENADLLIMESTYGGREHGPHDEAVAKLAKVVRETAERGGKVIIPSFSVGRSQQLVYSLHQLVERREIPQLPVYMDSPLSVNATEVFTLHPECFNDSVNARIRNHEDPFGLRAVTCIRAAEDSKALNDRPEPCVIVSAAGMCEAGRIRHHLRNNLGNPRNTILMVGFCAPHTLGHALSQPGVQEVSIFAEKVKVEAPIVVLDAFSAHADQSELLDLMARSTGAFRKIILVHGQIGQMETLAAKLRPGHPSSKILMPELHDSIEF